MYCVWKLGNGISVVQGLDLSPSPCLVDCADDFERMHIVQDWVYDGLLGMGCRGGMTCRDGPPKITMLWRIGRRLWGSCHCDLGRWFYMRLILFLRQLPQGPFDVREFVTEHELYALDISVIFIISGSLK